MFLGQTKRTWGTGGRQFGGQIWLGGAKVAQFGRRRETEQISKSAEKMPRLAVDLIRSTVKLKTEHSREEKGDKKRKERNRGLLFRAD